MPVAAAACTVGLAVEVDAGEGVPVDGWELIDEGLEAACQLAGGVVGFAVAAFGFGPALVVVEQWLVSPPQAIVVDHGVAGRPVEPAGRVVDGVESSSCQAAGEHVLGDVVGDVRVVHPSGDEGS